MGGTRAFASQPSRNSSRAYLIYENGDFQYCPYDIRRADVHQGPHAYVVPMHFDQSSPIIPNYPSKDDLNLDEDPLATNPIPNADNPPQCQLQPQQLQSDLTPTATKIPPPPTIWEFKH